MDRQILWDCHMHSSFSADSDTPMEVMIHRAVETGLQGITFTEDVYKRQSSSFSAWRQAVLYKEHPDTGSFRISLIHYILLLFLP